MISAMFDGKENVKIAWHQTENTLAGPSLSVLSYFFLKFRSQYIFFSFYLTPFDVGTYLRITIRFFVAAVRTWYLLSTESLALLPLLSSYFYDWNLCVDVRFILSFVNCAPFSIVMKCIVLGPASNNNGHSDSCMVRGNLKSHFWD